MNDIEIKGSHATGAWVAAFVVTAVFGYGWTPWETINQLLESGGVGDAEAQLMAFAAGYTLPATAATAVVAWLLLSGALRGMEGPNALGLVGVIYLGSAFLSATLGLIQLPATADWAWSGPLYLALPINALLVYLNAYGFGLTLTALAIGSALAVQLKAWQGSPTPTAA
jgi:hypothetical protein